MLLYVLGCYVGKLDFKQLLCADSFLVWFKPLNTIREVQRVLFYIRRALFLEMPKPHLRPRGSTELGNHIRLLWGLSEVIYLCVTPSMGPCTSDIYRVTVAFLLLFLLLLLRFLQLLVLFRYFDCNHHPFLKDLRFSIKRNRLRQDRGITAVKEQSPCTFRMGSIWVCQGAWGRLPNGKPRARRPPLSYPMLLPLPEHSF